MSKKSKKKKRKRKQPNHQQGRIESAQKSLSSKKRFKSGIRLFVGTMSFFAVLLALFFYAWPRFSVSRSILNPNNPFQNPFILKNTGYLPINIDYSVGIENLVDRNFNSIKIGNVKNKDYKIENLKPERSSPIDLSNFVRMPDNYVISSANLFIYINASPTILPFSTKETLKLNLKRTKNGHYVWYEFAN